MGCHQEAPLLRNIVEKSIRALAHLPIPNASDTYPPRVDISKPETLD